MAFTPPPASAGQCNGVPFEDARNVAADNKAAFDAFDRTPAGKNDPSKCKALLAFPGQRRHLLVIQNGHRRRRTSGGTRPANWLGTRPGTGTGRYKAPFFQWQRVTERNDPLHCAAGGSFRSNTGLAFGDVAIVIFKDKITAAICGDLGPRTKIGEGSIRVHEALHPPAPDPCIRDDNGFCRRIHNVSIDEDVLFFVFSESALDDLNAASLEGRIKERAFSLYNKLRGVS
jgi:hypothetical protein